jgi:hypothetical protein
MTDDGFRRLVQRMLPVEAQSGDDGAAPEADPSAPPSNGDALSRAAAAIQQPDLTPGNLVLTTRELEFIVYLAPMFTTPRAAKRLANVYQLLRAAIGDERLLEDDAFKPVLALLAISLAYPAEARYVFRALAEAKDTKLEDVLLHESKTDWWHSGAALSQLVADTAGGLRPLGEWRASVLAEWIPPIAEFSFHPWRDLVPDR